MKKHVDFHFIKHLHIFIVVYEVRIVGTIECKVKNAFLFTELMNWIMKIITQSGIRMPRFYTVDYILIL